MKNFWKNKNVLVTGGAGFIGSHAVRSLVEKHAHVTVVVSPLSDKEKINKNLSGVKRNIKIRKANLLDITKCYAVTKNMDIVLHFAALDGGSSFKQKHPAQVFKTNSIIVLNMLESSRRNNVDRFLLMSSIEVYPFGITSPITEDSHFMGNLQENGYAWSKRMSEIAAQMYYSEYGFRVAIARVGNVYGANDYLSEDRGRVIPTFINKAMKGDSIAIMGSGKQKKSFIHVTDLVSALLLLTEKYPVADPVNIAGEKYISIKALATLIVTLMKKKVKIHFGKKETGSIKQRIISVKKAKKLFSFKESIVLREGLQEVINSYMQLYEKK